MKIKVIGSGCSTCKKLHETVLNVLNEMKFDEEVEYIPDINKLIEAGITSSPALLINEKVVCAGRIPSSDEIRNWIEENSSKK